MKLYIIKCVLLLLLVAAGTNGSKAQQKKSTAEVSVTVVSGVMVSLHEVERTYSLENIGYLDFRISGETDILLEFDTAYEKKNLYLNLMNKTSQDITIDTIQKTDITLNYISY